MQPKKITLVGLLKTNGTLITFVIGLLSVAITIGVYQNKISTLENKVVRLETEIKSNKDETIAVSSKLDLLLNYFGIANSEKKTSTNDKK